MKMTLTIGPGTPGHDGDVRQHHFGSEEHRPADPIVMATILFISLGEKQLMHASSLRLRQDNWPNVTDSFLFFSRSYGVCV